MYAQPYINLNNQYDFQGYCAQRSIEAFQQALNTYYSPSRFNLLGLLVNDICYTPFYLTQRIVIDVTVNVFNFINTQKEHESWNQKIIVDLTCLITLQLLLPIFCQSMRISATVVGIFFPRQAVRGWQLAETGEYLSYALWSSSFQDANCQFQEQEVYEEITPSNAISYLGEKYTRACLNADDEDNACIEIEAEINEHFLNFLQTMAKQDAYCFCKLTEYQDAQDTQIPMAKIEQKSEQKNEQYYYLSHSAKQVLSKLYPFFDQNQSTNPDEYIKTIYEQLSIEEACILFNHISLNLNNACIENENINLEKVWLKSQLTLLKDLFSQRFKFGRAHFHQPLYSYNCYNPH